MKATEQYFPVVLFIMLYKVVLTFETVDEILKCDHSNENFCTVLSCGAVYFVARDGSSLLDCGCDDSIESSRTELPYGGASSFLE